MRLHIPYIDPETFRGKLTLLAIDKIVIGALIAGAVVVYDLRRTAELQRYETKAREVQLQFERAKLIKEFLPVIVGPASDVVTRAYVLRSAIATGSLDAEAGVELGRSLLAGGLDDQHFRRVMVSTMPHGLPVLARYGEQMSVRLRPISPLISDVTFRPESVAPDLRDPLREARLWRSVILEAVPRFEGSYAPLESTSGLSSLLYGLFVLLEPGDSWSATDLSHSKWRGLALIGNLGRVFFDSSAIAQEWSPGMQHSGTRYTEAASRVERELLIDNTSLDGIRHARAIIRILADYGPPAGTLAAPLARLLVAPGLPQRLPQSVQGAYGSLQWDAGELLMAMQKNPRNPKGFNGARDAEPVLVAFRSGLQEAHQPGCNPEGDRESL